MAGPRPSAARKRDAEDAQRDVRACAVAHLVARELAGLKSRGLYKETSDFPEVDDYMELFKTSAWRRPVLVIIGATNLGKSVLAARVHEKVADALGLLPAAFAEVTVEDDGHLDLSALDVAKHSGVLLDGAGGRDASHA